MSRRRSSKATIRLGRATAWPYTLVRGCCICSGAGCLGETKFLRPALAPGYKQDNRTSATAANGQTAGFTCPPFPSRPGQQHGVDVISCNDLGVTIGRPKCFSTSLPPASQTRKDGTGVHHERAHRGTQSSTSIFCHTMPGRDSRRRGNERTPKATDGATLAGRSKSACGRRSTPLKIFQCFFSSVLSKGIVASRRAMFGQS
ncbi:hypothetical protein LX32DRAFT_404798 [Colletotrichum zoysiae]|uniref:Uncharacterized protein n=1 Tax=Colletotrichum zoysiae TaxID=1216348 RepID=A0AAD9M4K4_9PEZI|nr:hypothetical protein LX32DRAFT_404798 [Colletotrichum zoysiae]